jgi:hypothetical protein
MLIRSAFRRGLTNEVMFLRTILVQKDFASSFCLVMPVHISISAEKVRCCTQLGTALYDEVLA